MDGEDRMNSEKERVIVGSERRGGWGLTGVVVQELLLLFVAEFGHVSGGQLVGREHWATHSCRAPQLLGAWGTLL